MKKSDTIIIIILLLIVLFLLFSCENQYKENNIINSSNSINEENTNTGSNILQNEETQAIDEKKELSIKNLEVNTWIEGLDTPWSLVFLDNNTALVSQRNGDILKINSGVLQKEIYLKIDSSEISEGGLMGLEKDPDFENNNFLYAMYTYRDGSIKNKVVRIIHGGNSGKVDKTLIDNIPGDRYHNGGRIKFGPDGKLYIATGDSSNGKLAQNLQSLAGKILRINPDGTIPNDNPFKDSFVYSYGHRNPQGIAFEPKTGDIFASVHGPTGENGWRNKDRIDYIVSGGNYGWPNVPGYSKEYRNPIIYWENESNPPAGMTFWYDKLFITTLKSQRLYMVTLEKENDNWKTTDIEPLFEGEYGRLRDAVVGPDNNLYILTSNKDGRGSPKSGDDKILIIKNKE